MQCIITQTKTLYTAACVPLSWETPDETLKKVAALFRVAKAAVLRTSCGVRGRQNAKNHRQRADLFIIIILLDESRGGMQTLWTDDMTMSGMRVRIGRPYPLPLSRQIGPPDTVPGAERDAHPPGALWSAFEMVAVYRPPSHRFAH